MKKFPPADLSDLMSYSMVPGFPRLDIMIYYFSEYAHLCSDFALSRSHELFYSLDVNINTDHKL